MSQKVTFCLQLRNDANNLTQVFKAVSDRVGFYFDRGYNTGGADPISDADAQESGLPDADSVGAMITLLQQLQNFLDNSAVTTGDYQSTLNTLRSDISGTA